MCCIQIQEEYRYNIFIYEEDYIIIVSDIWFNKIRRDAMDLSDEHVDNIKNRLNVPKILKFWMTIICLVFVAAALVWFWMSHCVFLLYRSIRVNGEYIV